MRYQASTSFKKKFRSLRNFTADLKKISKSASERVTMTEKMGFETDRRLRREYKNQPVDACIDDRVFHFRSIFEYNWAQYLEFLKDSGEIKDWDYESKDCVFQFTDIQYTIDFVTYQNDGSKEYYEVKGDFSQKDVRRFRLLIKYYPDVIVNLVVSSIPKRYKSPAGVWKRGKRRTNLYSSARKYVARIIEAKLIFRQLGSIIQPPPVVPQVADEIYRGRKQKEI